MSAPLLGGLVDQLASVLRGQRRPLELAVTALVAGGHLLIEDVPGTGKTALARALAASLELGVRRVQFTPDLLPTDITGVSVFDPKGLSFEFRPGPIFTDILLADEINRATPRAQSALLEAMEERQVSVDGESRPLGEEFFVIATQNPIEQQGTFPLPEAQLDRFALRISLGYPPRSELSGILAAHREGSPVSQLRPIADREALRAARAEARAVMMEASVEEYLFEIAEATRAHPSVALGASTRAILTLASAARAHALLQGRRFTLPDDVKALAPAVLGHRLVLEGQARMTGQRAEGVLRELLDDIPAPVAPAPQSAPPGP